MTIAEINDKATKAGQQEKRKKMLIGACAVAVLIAISIITVIAIALQLKTPTLSLGHKPDFLTVITETNPEPFFNISFNTQVRVKNSNLLGTYKFEMVSLLAELLFQKAESV